MIACAKCGITRSSRTSTPRQGAQRSHNASSVGCVNRPFGRATAKSSASRTSPTVMGTACNDPTTAIQTAIVGMRNGEYRWQYISMNTGPSGRPLRPIPTRHISCQKASNPASGVTAV